MTPYIKQDIPLHKKYIEIINSRIVSVVFKSFVIVSIAGTKITPENGKSITVNNSQNKIIQC